MRKQRIQRERKGVHETKGIAERRMARRDRVSLTLENGEEKRESVKERERRGGSVIVNLSRTTGWLAEILKVPPS